MISRVLGLEFGGSIGFLFFVVNVLVVGFYVIGFVEVMIENFGLGGKRCFWFIVSYSNKKCYYGSYCL